MRKLFIIPAALLIFCLLAGCGGQGGGEIATRPNETTAERIIGTEAMTTTEAIPEPTQQSTDDLLDLALLGRLFSMTLADFFEEEGAKKQPEDEFEAGPYYSFSKYDPTSYFFFEGYSEANTPSSMALEATDLLIGRRSLTLGEMKQWLTKGNIKYHFSDFEGFSCCFTVGGYTLFAYTEDDNESDAAIVRRFFAKPKD